MNKGVPVFPTPITKLSSLFTREGQVSCLWTVHAVHTLLTTLVQLHMYGSREVHFFRTASDRVRVCCRRRSATIGACRRSDDRRTKGGLFLVAIARLLTLELGDKINAVAKSTVLRMLSLIRYSHSVKGYAARKIKCGGGVWTVR